MVEYRQSPFSSKLHGENDDSQQKLHGGIRQSPFSSKLHGEYRWSPFSSKLHGGI